MLQIYLSLLVSSQDEEKFKSLYFTYNKLLHYIAKDILKDNMLAEDAVQETFLRVAKNFEKVGEINCPQTKKFLVIIVRRVSFTMFGKMDMAESDEKIEIRADMMSYEQYYKREQYAEIVNQILSLSETYKQVLYLHYVFQYTAPEIANLLGISVETVKKRMQRGKKLVIEGFQKEVEHDE